MAEALCSGVAAVEAVVARAIERGAHEFVGAGFVFAVAEDGSPRGALDLFHFCGLGDALIVAVADVTRVVVVASVGLDLPVCFADKRRTLLDLARRRVVSPEDAGGKRRRLPLLHDRGNIPAV